MGPRIHFNSAVYNEKEHITVNNNILNKTAQLTVKYKRSRSGCWMEFSRELSDRHDRKGILLTSIPCVPASPPSMGTIYLVWQVELRWQTFYAPHIWKNYRSLQEANSRSNIAFSTLNA